MPSFAGEDAVKGFDDDPLSEKSELSLEGFKRAHVRRVLEACDGDVEKAAQLLDMDPEEVLRWLQAANHERA